MIPKARKSLRVSSVKFRTHDDGSNTIINPGNITVFIGPNNGGKSRSLKEIRTEFTGEIFPSEQRIFVESSEVTEIEESDIDKMIDEIAMDGIKIDPYNRPIFHVAKHGQKNKIVVSNIKSLIERQDTDNSYRSFRENLLQYFILDLGGKNRLELLADTVHQDIKSTPHSLAGKFFLDDILRTKLSNLAVDAFGFHVSIDPTNLGVLRFVGSHNKPDAAIERSLTDKAVAFFRDCFDLSSRSDGTRAFIGIYAEVMGGNSEIIFVDEPEAFLHPSLARGLAQEISKNITSGKQLFSATHSASFLSGLISSSDDTTVVRLSQHGESRSVKALSSKDLNAMMKDPLLRSVNILDALFYESCVVVEGDGDSAFYREINDRLQRHGRNHVNHGSFICCHGKHSAPRIIEPLRRIGIPTACILDIDWIKEDGSVATRYFSSIGIPSNLIPSMISERKSVRKLLEDKSANYKREGGIGLLSDEELLAANMFFDRCETFGLFTVRNGELESWLPKLEISRSKNSWIGSVFDAMGGEPAEKNYVAPTDGDVWQFVERVGEWLKHKRF